MLCGCLQSEREREKERREKERRKGKEKERKGKKGKERKGKERKARKGKERKGKEKERKERKGKERKGKERKGKERKGKERKGKERKERKGKERKERKGKEMERKGKERKGKDSGVTVVGIKRVQFLITPPAISGVDNYVLVLSTAVYQHIHLSPTRDNRTCMFLEIPFCPTDIVGFCCFFLEEAAYRRQFAFWVLLAVALNVNHISGVVRD